jgi:hypothetical protein
MPNHSLLERSWGVVGVCCLVLLRAGFDMKG